MNKSRSTLLMVGFSFVLLSACIEKKNSSTDFEENAQWTLQMDDSLHLAKGAEISAKVFSVLSSQVGKKMQTEGLEKTITYCQTNAYPITDSLAKLNQASIKRSSHKIRNPLNSPDSLERIILTQYISSKEKNSPLTQKVYSSLAGETRFFAPIIMSGGCVKCHGELGREIPKDNYELIKNAYPNDQAIGFAVGDLRGIWSITFKN